METFRENLNSIIVCVFELIIGILLLIEPVRFTSGIIIAAGIILIVIAILYFVRYFRMDARKAAVGQFFAKGLMALLTGSFLVFHSEWFIATFPVLTMLYGVVILLSALEKIQLCIDMFRLKKAKWYFAGISTFGRLNGDYYCSFFVYGNFLLSR